jgi:hypothetical protein
VETSQHFPLIVKLAFHFLAVKLTSIKVSAAFYPCRHLGAPPLLTQGRSNREYGV